MFVSANQAIAPVATMCLVFGVSESGYYAWRKRGPAARAQRDVVLVIAIRAAHERSDGSYGAATQRRATDVVHHSDQGSQGAIQSVVATPSTTRCVWGDPQDGCRH